MFSDNFYGMPISIKSTLYPGEYMHWHTYKTPIGEFVCHDLSNLDTIRAKLNEHYEKWRNNENNPM